MRTPKHAKFVAEYLVDLNGRAAAIRAGYSPRNPHAAEVQAARLLARPDIAAAVAAGKAKQLAALDITAEKVLREIARLSFSDLRTLFDQDGNLKSIHTLNADEAACIASLEVVKKNLTAGDGQMDTVIKLKVWDKTRSLEMLAKHFALLTEKVEHGGAITLRHEMAD